MKKTKEKFVVTKSGLELPISKCKKIEGEYYKLGNVNVENSGECFLIGTKIILAENLIYDHELKTHISNVNNNKNIVKGIVGIENNDFKIGFFTKNMIKNIMLFDISGKILQLMNKDIILNSELKNIYREKLMDGNFYHILKIPAYEFVKIYTPDIKYKESLPYNSKEYIERSLKFYNASKIEIEKEVSNASKLLLDYSFGLEFETIKGYLTNSDVFENGLIPLRDGSISGIEYVTIPLVGEKGLQTLKNSLTILNSKTKFNDSCSLHLHIGNLPRTEDLFLSFFISTLFL